MMGQAQNDRSQPAVPKTHSEGRHGETCGSVEHKIHRRLFLEGAVASALSVFSFSGLFSVPAFAAMAKREQKHCILLWLCGAPSQFETWDPKPGRPTAGPFRSIPSKIPGVHLSELMARTATITDKLAIIRSMKTSQKEHFQAILFPVFAQAREKARQTSCLSNLRQLGTGMLLYMQDYDERYPFVPCMELGGTTVLEITGQVYPYLNNCQILVCPSAPEKVVTTVWPCAGDVRLRCPTNYGFNAGQDGNWALRTKPLAAIEEPVKTVMVADAWAKTQVMKGQPVGLWWLGGDKWTADNYSYGISNRHSLGASFLFFDGHARWIHRTAFKVQRDYKNTNPTAPYRFE